MLITLNGRCFGWSRDGVLVLELNRDGEPTNADSVKLRLEPAIDELDRICGLRIINPDNPPSKLRHFHDEKEDTYIVFFELGSADHAEDEFEPCPQCKLVCELKQCSACQHNRRLIEKLKQR